MAKKQVAIKKARRFTIPIRPVEEMLSSVSHRGDPGAFYALANTYLIARYCSERSAGRTHLQSVEYLLPAIPGMYRTYCISRPQQSVEWFNQHTPGPSPAVAAQTGGQVVVEMFAPADTKDFEAKARHAVFMEYHALCSRKRLSPHGWRKRNRIALWSVVTLMCIGAAVGAVTYLMPLSLEFKSQKGNFSFSFPASATRFPGSIGGLPRSGLPTASVGITADTVRSDTLGTKPIITTPAPGQQTPRPLAKTAAQQIPRPVAVAPAQPIPQATTTAPAQQISQPVTTPAPEQQIPQPVTAVPPTQRTAPAAVVTKPNPATLNSIPRPAIPPATSNDSAHPTTTNSPAVE
jgi:hypothetical protein